MWVNVKTTLSGNSVAGMTFQLDESVHLAQASENWTAIFEAERARLVAALGIAADQVEHIGCTAVAGLLAKPVVDIQLGVQSYPPPQTMSQGLVRLGYESHASACLLGSQRSRRSSLARRGAGQANTD
jgi:GrpB-like predicted nucleotidyltransferase (UPF0157 family)